MCSGCTQLADVNLRLVVHAVGIDVDDDGVYTVSYQVFAAQPSGSGGPVDATDQNVITMVMYGRSIYEAQKNLELQTGKEVLTGDTELIVLGDSFFGRDISGVLSYFWNNYDIYMGVNVVFTDGRASDVVSAELEHGTAAAELLNQMISAASKYSVSAHSRLIDISNRLKDDCSGFIMPVISARASGAADIEGLEDSKIYDKAIGVFKSVLISGGTPVRYLEPEEASGICMLTDRADLLALELMAGSSHASAEVKIDSVKRSVDISEDGSPKIDVKINGTLKIRDNPDGCDPALIADGAKKEIFERCGLGYSAVMEYPCDAFEIIRLLKKYRPDYLEAYFGGYNELLSSSSVRVSVSLTVREK